MMFLTVAGTALLGPRSSGAQGRGGRGGPEQPQGKERGEGVSERRQGV